jgi:hypothetical protein
MSALEAASLRMRILPPMKISYKLNEMSEGKITSGVHGVGDLLPDAYIQGIVSAGVG